MSSKLPGRREKPHSSKPYDRPKSFLQRVTKQVAGYLPSWLNPSSWVAKESEQPAFNDLPDEDTGAEEDLDIAGPSGLSAPVTQSTSQRAGLALTPSGTSQFTRKPLERSPPTTQQILVNGDDHSDNSETSASTSGCSSLAPSQERKRALSSEARASTQLKGLQVSKHHLEKIQQQLNSKPLFTIPGSETEQTPSTVSSSEVPTAPLQGATVEPQRTNDKTRKRVSVEHCASQNVEKDADTSSTRTSLWSEDEEKSSQTNKRPRTARPQPVAPNKRPCFSVSAFGSPLRIPHDRNPQSSESNLSPFYRGNTTYGGASAYKKARISAPYNSALRSEAMKVRQAGSTGVLSSAAQKVLNILENMSTPLTDAKKIPVENISTDFALSYTPSIYARRPLRQDAQQSMITSTGPPKTSYPIHTPSTPQQPTLLLTALSKTSPTRSVSSATPISWSHSDEQPKKSGGAVRTRVSQSLRPSKQQRELEEEPVTVPDLPQIPLLFKGSSAQFRLSIPTLTSTPLVESHPPAEKTKVIPVIDLDHEKETPLPGSLATTDKFVFSSPIVKKPPVKVVLDDTREKDIFTFRSPVFKSPSSSENDKISPVSRPVPKSPAVTFNFSAAVNSSATSPLKRKKPVEQNSEDSLTVAAGLRPAAELMVGRSVMDILGKPTVSATEDTKASQEKTTFPGFGSAFQKKSTEWDCSVCMVRNKDTALSCVACTSPRPSSKPATNTLTATPTPGFGSSFAPPSGSWSCPTCMVNNTETAVSCVACTELKPGLSKSKADVVAVTTKSVQNTPEVPAGCPKQWVGPPVVSSAGTWECDACLVRNKDGVSKCCACETPRPNTSATGVKDTFTGFKFGLANKDSTSSACKFGSTDTSSPAKGLSSSSAFGLLATNTKDASSTFKFGVPASSDSTGPPSASEDFKFGVPSAKDSQTTPKLLEGIKFGATDSVTKAPFGLTTNTSSSAVGFKFGVPNVRTDKESEKATETVSLSAASTETDKSSSECVENKPEAKSGFVFGGQSVVAEKKSETTPTLTFGQKADNSSKPDLSAKKSTLKSEGTLLSAAKSEQKGARISFGDSKGQSGGLGFKFGAGSQSTEPKSGSSVNGSSDKQNVTSMFAFGNRGTVEGGKKGLTSDVPAPAASSGFQFSFKGKDSESEAVKPLTTAPVFGASQMSSTTTVSLSSFTTTTAATPSTPKSSVTFGAAVAADSMSAPITPGSSASTGTQNSTAPFVFGSSKPAQAPAVPAGGFCFSFGSSTPGNAVAKPASTTMPFTFGSTAAPANNASSVPPASAAPFTFGKADPAPGSNNAAPQQTTPVFSFGAAPNTSYTSNSGTGVFGTSQAASKPVFSFGAQSGPAPNATPSLPAFGQQQQSVGGTAVTTEAFTFGTGTAAAPSSGVFQIDAAKPSGTSAQPVFRFGVQQAENGSNQQSLFGASPSNPGAFPFGSTTVPSGTPFAGSSPFVFGSGAVNAGANPANSAQLPAASGPSFPFPAGNPPGNPFSVSGGTGSSAKRPIRKAIRRVTKK